MSKPYKCIWNILLVCNYRCSYCPIRFDDPGVAAMHEACTADEWTAFWDRMFRRYGSFTICISGGEPTLYRNFFPMVGRLGGQHRIRVNTNLWWKPSQALKWITRDTFEQFNASFHPQFAELGPFLDKVKALQDAGLSVSTMIVAYPPAWERLPEYEERFRAAGAKAVFEPFRGQHAGKTYPAAYSPAELEWLRRKSDFVPQFFDFKVSLRSPKGRLCETGSRYFTAAPNGDFFRCASEQWMFGRKIGSVKDPAFSLAPEAAPCPAERCACAAEYFYLNEVEPGGIMKSDNFSDANTIS